MMKNKKSTPPAPILCKLMNGPDKFDNHSVIFNLIDILISRQDPIMTEYFGYLNFFNTQQYILFCNRISNKRNKEIQVNQLHIIIFYAMVHLTIQLYQSERIKELVHSLTTEIIPQTFEEKKVDLDPFCNKVLRELKKECKRNNMLIIAMNKIDAYSISN